MGTRVADYAAETAVQDHPHAYGDKVLNLSALRPYVGSSPRVWGQEIGTLFNSRDFRIIPTRMGTSCVIITKKGGVKDHPHAYGDKIFFCLIHTSFIGSSPRVWGQALGFYYINSGGRIIPTRMGTRLLYVGYMIER